MLDRKKEIGKAEKKRRGRETPVACRRREKKKNRYCRIAIPECPVP
jgi:hypothetical protein